MGDGETWFSTRRLQGFVCWCSDVSFAEVGKVPWIVLNSQNILPWFAENHSCVCFSGVSLWIPPWDYSPEERHVPWIIVVGRCSFLLNWSLFSETFVHFQGCSHHFSAPLGEPSISTPLDQSYSRDTNFFTFTDQTADRESHKFPTKGIYSHEIGLFIWSNYSNLTRPKTPKGSWRREMGPLISGKSRWNIVIWPYLSPISQK